MPESSVRPRRIVVGVSGASGAALGLECLKCLRQAGAAWLNANMLFLSFISFSFIMFQY